MDGGERREGGVTGKEDAAAGAGEVVGLGGLADAGDGFEGVVEHEDLHEAGKCGSHDLGHEHGARRDLHVVAEFQVGDKGQGLRHGDVAEGFEAAVVSLQSFKVDRRRGRTS